MQQTVVAGQPTKFVCAVCDEARPLVVEGKQNYTTAKGGDNKICSACTNKADEKAIAEGKGISLNIDLIDGQWFALNATGKLAFKLEPRQPGLRLIQWLAAPMFTHKGRRWAGRTYHASGTGYFTPQPAKEPTAGGRDGKATPAKATPAKAGARRGAKGGRPKAKALPAGQPV